MNTWPSVSDAIFAEYVVDTPRKPGTLVAENGSLICTCDYALMTAMARELLEVRS